MNNTYTNNSPENSILVILEIAREADIKYLTRTELVKYLYLLDVYVAMETSGTKWTNIEWKFLHFGPFSPSVVMAIDVLVSKTFIDERAIQSNSKDGYMYSLPSWKVPKSWEDLGIPREAIFKIKEFLRRFKSNLPALLNFTYFETFPMQDAVPEHVLLFDSCSKTPFKDLIPIKMNQINPKILNTVREKIKASLAKPSKNAQISWSGKFDDIYWQGIKQLENISDTATELSGRIYL